MKKAFYFVAIIMLCVTLLSLQSCKDKGEEEYTVWTETVSYAEIQAKFQFTLDDGYYKKVELTKAQWEQMTPFLTDEGRHSWSEASIKKWLVGHGFGENESTKESCWLVMTDHGLIMARDGNMVSAILK